MVTAAPLLCNRRSPGHLWSGRVSRALDAGRVQKSPRRDFETEGRNPALPQIISSLISHRVRELWGGKKKKKSWKVCGRPSDSDVWVASFWEGRQISELWVFESLHQREPESSFKVNNMTFDLTVVSFDMHVVPSLYILYQKSHSKTPKLGIYMLAAQWGHSLIKAAALSGKC